MAFSVPVGWAVVAVAAAAIGYALLAGHAVRRFARAPLPPAIQPRPITLLKPLHGAEPALAANLATFLAQEWAAPVQLVAGANDEADPALAIARALTGDIAVRGDAPTIGTNPKVANLANMMPAATHDLLVISDSDIAVPPGWLARVAATLAVPGIGAVTCLYGGRGDAGAWSRVAAAGITWQFMPGVALSLLLGIDHPCMGSTIALERRTLAAIGGFAAFADLLADDYAIGAAVRRLGLGVAAAAGLVVTHGCTERSLAAVWRHELRWAATVRAINPAGHAGSLLTHPLPLALLAMPLHPLVGVVLTATALAARVALARAAERAAGHPPAPLVWLPARDLLSFTVFVASFFVRRIDWRGQALRMAGEGRIVAAPEPPRP